MASLKAVAQTAPAACGAPPAILKSTQPNIFSEQQEQWLGDAMADQIERDYRPVKDAGENAYLQRIGERVLKALPKSSIQFRFLMVDSPEVNGFSLAGGRVYLTRKLVVNAHSEDEVAGVVAHEIGHILTHQFAVETTADLKRLLGVTSVSDRADIYAKFQRLTDARMKDRHSSGGDTDEKQDQADRVSVYAVAAAGYRPQGYAEFWDRSFYVGGKTGSSLGDFFGMTKPNEKRLRELRRLVAALPPGCGAVEAAKSQAFDQWHRQVVENQASEAANVPVSVAEVKLSPPITLELERLRFSQDGRRILAQNESSVYVLNREPFELLFRFDAEDAQKASFTRDGEQITFNTPALHVERWGVKERKLVEAHEMIVHNPCLESILTPDGRTVLCVRWGKPDTLDGSEMSLQLLDVATGDVVAEKPTWFEPSFLFTLMMAYGLHINTSGWGVAATFSSDGDTVMLGPGSSKLAFDLRTRTPIKLGVGAQHGFDAVYTFMGNDKVAGLKPDHPKDSGLFSFPEGKVLKKVTMDFDNLEATTDGRYGMVGLKDGGRSLIDFETEKMVLSVHRHRAMDSWGGSIVYQNATGAVGMQKVGNTDPKTVEKLELPPSPLSRASAAAISPDGRYLAYSVRARSGVWDTTTGKQVFLLKSFLQANWLDNNVLLAEFPKDDKDPLRIGQMLMSSKAASTQAYTLEEHAHLESRHLLVWKDLGKNKWQLDVRDPANNALVWSRSFTAGRPAYTNNQLDDDLIFSYALNSPAAKERLKADGTLDGQARAVAAKDKDYGRLIEVVDQATGTTRKQVVVVRPRSYAGVDGYMRVGDLLYLSVGDNRTIVYSMTTGQELRQMFGIVVSAEGKSEKIATINRRGEATVYDKGGAQIEHLELGVPVRFAAFTDGGKRLLVLTSDQRVRQFEVGMGSK